MRLDEFKRIKLKVFKNDTLIYEGEAEEIPEELKASNTVDIKIQPGLAIVKVEEDNNLFELQEL
ncbi:MAG: hypothetical protein J6C46_01205 [Clostridia bacterium]|nr:hypothetical protein [Clostridia bacterium]